MRRLAVSALVVAGCGGLKAGLNPDANGGNPDAMQNSDAPVQCTTSVLFSPDPVVAGAGSVVVATGSVSNQQTFASYTWIVKFGNTVIPTTQQDQAGLVVSFPVVQAGPYAVHFAAGNAVDCVADDTSLQVQAPGANTQAWRMRVTPAPGAGAPPQEQLVNVIGGAPEDYGTIQLAPGFDTTSTIVDAGGAPVAAYLRFTPAAAPDTFVEAFSSSAGAWEARVPGGPQDVLIVPTSASLAPARIASWSPLQPALVVPAAATIAGTVLGPGGAPLAGARVALAIAGVPTTIATTDSSGAWSVLGHLGGAVDVTVVPPAASGLPELAVTGTSLDATKPIAIHYAALATIDLAGTPVTAAGAAAPGATITFTGAIPNAGSITAGTTSSSAGGVIAATAIAGAGGLLGATPVPRAPMSAVVASPAGIAVVALDTTAGAPASINAAAPVAITGTITEPSGTPHANARVRLAPIGALAAATLVAPTATTGADGTFSIAAAPGGHYALDASDPVQQYASNGVADVTAGNAGTVALRPAIAFSAKLQVTASSQPVAGAAVTFLCATCTGADRAQPVAEAVSAAGGNFTLAVPDPGTSLR
jgi:hypothetical protein